MFAKIAVIILAMGVCACSLLALRQARLQAANELAEARLRVRALDERISVVRTAIAAHVTPEEVEAMIRQTEAALEPLALRRWRPEVEAVEPLEPLHALAAEAP